MRACFILWVLILVTSNHIAHAGILTPRLGGNDGVDVDPARILEALDKKLRYAAHGKAIASDAKGDYARLRTAYEAGSSASVVPAAGALAVPGLEAYWRFEEGSGTTAGDASGGGHTGQLQGGPAWTSGHLGTALSFDGLNDYVEIADAPALNPTRSVTLMAWFRKSATGGSNATGVEKREAYRLLFKEAGVGASPVLFDFWNSQGTFTRLTSQTRVESGVWHHVAGVYDGAELRLYIDGELDAVRAAGGAIRVRAWPFQVGRRGGASYYAGAIDEVQLYGRALSQAEINEAMLGGGGGEPGNTPPQVTITSPSGGALFSEGDDVALAASASDGDGSVVEVEFFAGSVKLGEDGSAPYAMTWSSVAAGTYVLTAVATDDDGATTTSSPVSIMVAALGEGPTVDVWHGLSQRVGHLGDASDDFDVLGHVSDPDGVASLTYRLNGAAPVALTVLDEPYRRLVAPGDFIADIPVSSLQPGTNLVELRATDQLGNVTFTTVTVEKETGSYPLPVQIDWSDVSDPQAVGQYVDGLWQKTAAGLRIMRPGYDRLFLIGERSWQDYDISVPVTIHSVNATTGPHSGWPGLGLLMRFTGHIVGGHMNWPEEQPKWGHLPFGTITWLRWTGGASRAPVKEHFRGDFSIRTSYGSYPITLGNTYWMRMRSETLADAANGEGRTRYQWKIWQAGASEPAAWDIDVTQQSEYALRRGGFVLIAHEVEATFGDVTVTGVGSGASTTLQGEDGLRHQALDVAPASVQEALSVPEADVAGNVVELRWRGLSGRYVVEHAEGAGGFSPVGEVDGPETEGNEAPAGSYVYRTEQLPPGLHRFRLAQNGRTSASVAVEVSLQETYALTEAYPNPFNPVTRLRVSVREGQHVRVAVYDVMGRLVSRTWEGELGAQASREVVLDGSGWSSGLYLVRVEGERFTATRKILLLK